MAQEKVTREELLAMKIGETCVFTLVNKTKLQSVASTLTQLKNEEKGEWTHHKDYVSSTIEVTRVK